MNDIIILAGGGGHTALAQIICEILKDYDKIIYIPEGDDISREKLQNYGQILELPKFKGPLQNISIGRLFKALFRSIFIKKAKILISTGSNFALLPSFFSKLKGTYLINFEVPDRIYSPSKTAKILDKIADVTYLHWKEQEKNFKKGKVFGPLIYLPEVYRKKEDYIVLFTGTLTFSKLRNIIRSLIKISEDIGYRLIIKGKYSKFIEKSDNVILINKKLSDIEVDELLKKASLVIAHPGYTMFRAISFGTPVLLYFPEEYRQHSIEDINFLSRKFNINWFKDRVTGDIIEESMKKIPNTLKENVKKAYKFFKQFIDNKIIS